MNNNLSTDNESLKGDPSKPILVDSKFPRITKKLLNGKYLYSINGRRMVRGAWIGERRSAWTEEEALEIARNIRKKNDLKYNNGKYGHETIVFVHKAEEKLKEYGVPVEKALDEYINLKELELRNLHSKTLEKVWDEFIEYHLKSNSSPHTIRTYRSVKNLMTKRFGSGTPVRLLAEKQLVLDQENIVQKFIKNELNKYHLNYRDNIRRNINAFFNFCFKQRYIEQYENPCLRLTGKRIKKDPSVLTVDEAERLLRTAETYDQGMVSYIALMIFGGLRPTEANLLKPENIDWANNQILIPKSISKVKRGRTFNLNPPLKEWLLKYNSFDKTNYRKRMDKIKHLSGFKIYKEDKNAKRWEPDVCRHTSITMFLAKNNYQYGLCASQFGNSEDVIRTHYEAFSRPSKEDVERFYSLMPDKIEGHSNK